MSGGSLSLPDSDEVSEELWGVVAAILQFPLRLKNREIVWLTGRVLSAKVGKNNSSLSGTTLSAFI